MNRKRSSRIIELNDPIITLIRELKKDHPFWDYRRVWAALRYHNGLIIN